MLATFLRVDGEKNSVPSKLKFKIRLQGEKGDNFTVFELVGEVKLVINREMAMQKTSLGRFYPIFQTFFVNETKKNEYEFYLDFDENKRYFLENERGNGDVKFEIRLDYLYFNFGKTPQGSERVRAIASRNLSVKNAEGSSQITIEQSRWNKVIAQLGYHKRLLFELPIDFEEILSSIPKHPQEGLIRRIGVATKSFQKALNKLRDGKWRDAVVESRKVYEALSKKKLKNGKEVKEEIQALLLKYGLPKQNKENITDIIEEFWKYTSPTHHSIDSEGKDIKDDEPTMFGREDAYLTVTTAGLLIKMLSEKLMS